MHLSLTTPTANVYYHHQCCRHLIVVFQAYIEPHKNMCGDVVEHTELDSLHAVILLHSLNWLMTCIHPDLNCIALCSFS